MSLAFTTYLRFENKIIGNWTTKWPYLKKVPSFVGEGAIVSEQLSNGYPNIYMVKAEAVKEFLHSDRAYEEIEAFAGKPVDINEILSRLRQLPPESIIELTEWDQS